MTRTTRRIQVRGRSIAALELPPLAESLALPASASELLADAQTAARPQPAGAAITPFSAVVAWVGAQPGRSRA